MASMTVEEGKPVLKSKYTKGKKMSDARKPGETYYDWKKRTGDTKTGTAEPTRAAKEIERQKKERRKKRQQKKAKELVAQNASEKVKQKARKAIKKSFGEVI